MKRNKYDVTRFSDFDFAQPIHLEPYWDKRLMWKPYKTPRVNRKCFLSAFNGRAYVKVLFIILDRQWMNHRLLSGNHIIYGSPDEMSRRK